MRNDATTATAMAGWINEYILVFADRSTVHTGTDTDTWMPGLG